MGKLFSTRAAITKFKFWRAAQYVAKAVSELDCHAIKMKNMLKYFETIIHPLYGNALHIYNAFIRYQAIRKTRITGDFLLDTSSWRATKKDSVGRSLPTPGLNLATWVEHGRSSTSRHDIDCYSDAYNCTALIVHNNSSISSLRQTEMEQSREPSHLRLNFLGASSTKHLFIAMPEFLGRITN